MAFPNFDFKAFLYLLTNLNLQVLMETDKCLGFQKALKREQILKGLLIPME